MSASNPTADPSTVNLTAIFDAASNEYRSLTGQSLGTHPLATELDHNNSPGSILGVFRKQAQALNNFRKCDDKLMKSLTPIVHVIYARSATLGAGIRLVSPHCFYTVLQYLFLSHSRPQLCFLLASVFSFRGKSLLISFCCAFVNHSMQVVKRYYCELQNACQPTSSSDPDGDVEGLLH